MKRSAYYLIISLFLTGITACNQQQRNNNSNQDYKEGSEDTISASAQNIDAMVLHEKLMNSFSADWIERESDPELYPDYYGGSFVDNDGDFVIAVTGNVDKNRARLTNILGTSDFKIETVRYSYRQMMMVMDDIDSFLINSNIPDNHPVLEKFAGAYPDVMDNRVKVLLTEVNDNIVNSFKKDISNSPLIVFEQGEIPEMY